MISGRTPTPASSDAESDTDRADNVRQSLGDSDRPQHISYTPSYIAARALGFTAADRDAKLLPFLDRPFPRLRELTVLGLHRLREVLVHGDGLDGFPVLFPAATHLHLFRKDLWMWPYVDLALLETHAPGVTHLRSTCFCSLGGRLRAVLALRQGSSLAEMLGASLAASLGIAQDNDDDEAHPTVGRVRSDERRAYPSLRYVVLQPDVPPAATHQNLIQESLGHLESACRARGVEIMLFEPCTQPFKD